MSGNPFRRQASHEQRPAASPQRGEARLHDEFIQSPVPDPPRKSSVIKRVRIQTPPPLSPDPITPQDEYSFESRYPQFEEAASPPPPEAITNKLPGSLEGNEYSFINRQALENDFFPSQEVAENTRRNSEANTAGQQVNSDRMPFNPFQKTLATIEPAGIGSEMGGRKGSRDGAQKAMDVDSFKRLLMTGNAGPAPTSAGAAVVGAVFGSGDDAATTRNKNHTSNVRASPISSLDDAESASEEDDPSTDGKAKPPPPIHRHGKPVNQRTPQVVSFSDFSTVNFGAASTSLPRTPAQSNDSQDVAPPALPARDAEPPPLPIRTSQRLPPPPPAVRGHNRNRSTSNTSTKSASTVGPGRESSPGPPQSQTMLKPPSSRAPPPPPARRLGLKGIPSPEATSTPDVTESAPQAEDEFSFDPTYPPPRPSLGAMSSSRSASFSSRGGSGASAPPPPPPPRRRGSSKGSQDVPRLGTWSPSESRRTSGEQHRTSMDSARRVSGGLEADAVRRGSGDVLADLSALQAEVDALRQRVRPI